MNGLSLFSGLSARDMMNDLLEAEIIPQEKIRSMVEDQQRISDPNLTMEIRHAKIKEKRKRMKKRRDERNLQRSRINETNNFNETVLVDEEIKKLQRSFQTETRKMTELIKDIKNSDTIKTSKEQRDKSAKPVSGAKADKGSTTDSNASYSLATCVTNQLQDVAPSIKDDRHLEIEQNLSKLKEIRVFLESLDNIQSDSFDDQVEDNDSTGVNKFFNAMDNIIGLSKQQDADLDENDASKSTTSNNKDEQEEEDLNLNLVDKTEDNLNLFENNDIVLSNDNVLVKSKEANSCTVDYDVIETLVVEEMPCCTDNEIDNANISSSMDDDDVIVAGASVVCNFENNDSGDVREMYLSRKFYVIWKNNVNRQRNPTPRNLVESRFETFLNKLQQRIDKPGKDQSIDRDDSRKDRKQGKYIKNGETIFNRYNAQKDIIEKQRIILKEQNERIKSLEESAIGIGRVIEEKVKENNVVKTKETKVKQKATTNLLETPKFLENMNKRAEERREKWKKLKEIKLQKEEEMVKKKLLEEEERKKKVEQQKYAALQAEQMEYLKKILREQEAKREAELVQVAVNKITSLYRETLLKQCIDVWKTLLERRADNFNRIKRIFDTNLQRKSLHSLRINIIRNQERRQSKADRFRENKLQQKYWTIWNKSWKENKDLNQVAEDYNSLRLTERSFIGLMWNNKCNKRKLDELMLEAISFYKTKLLAKAFKSLKVFPHYMNEEREKEKRLRTWEEKVKEVVPDFSIT